MPDPEAPDPAVAELPAVVLDDGPELPADFTIGIEDGLPVLIWGGEEVWPGGARPELRVGEEVVGFPREVDGDLQLPLNSEVSEVLADPAAVAELEVWSGGRRLDDPEGAAARSARPQPVVEGSGARPVGTNPGRPGRFDTERLSYKLAPLPVPGYAEPIEVLAEVTRPVRAGGDLPVVVVLHGRSVTCFRGGPAGEATGGWPCREGFEPVPSYLGYRYLTDVLASQGYLAVSISANAINGQDFADGQAGAGARSALVRHHLGLWAQWDAEGGDPWGGQFRGQVDLDRVALVGHSRGGEGVHRAAIDASAADPFRIRGIASYGPTAFGRQVTPDVHSATILPTCDGDVSDLQGQAYIDESRDLAGSPALRSAVIAVGANHNFFNTEWTPGLSTAPARDDWFESTDPVCGDAGSVRLDATEQQNVAVQYTMALVRLALADQRRMVQLLDGTPVKPSAVGDTEIAVHAVGGDRELLYRPEAAGEPTLSAGMSGGECAGYPAGGPVLDAPDEAACGEAGLFQVAPHWLPVRTADSRPAPQALELSWQSEGATAVLPIDAAALTLRRGQQLDIRVANDPAAEAAGLAVRLTDTRGRSAVVPASPELVEGWPGDEGLDRVHARTLRADLRQARGVRVRELATVELVATSPTGRVWVLDVAASRSRLTEPEPLNLPRISVATVVEDEGSDVRTIEVPITVEEPLPAPAEVWVEIDPGPSAPPEQQPESFLLSLPAGASGTVETVVLTVAGDDLFSILPDPLNGGRVTLIAESGVVTGDFSGGITLIDDDPAPTLDAVARTVEVAEGEVVRWTLQLSEPTTGVGYLVFALPPAEGTELSSDDVDPAFIAQVAALFGLPPEVLVPTPVPLSQVGIDLFGIPLPQFIRFGPGQQELVLEIPTVTDDVTEGPEVVTLTVDDGLGDLTLPEGGLTLTGVVTDSP